MYQQGNHNKEHNQMINNKPKIEGTSFTKTVLTEAYEREGQSLNELQRAVLQNRRADLAEEILGHTFTFRDGGAEYGVTLAYLQGQLDSLTHSLSLSDEATSYKLYEAQNQADS